MDWKLRRKDTNLPDDYAALLPNRAVRLQAICNTAVDRQGFIGGQACLLDFTPCCA